MGGNGCDDGSVIFDDGSVNKIATNPNVLGREA